MSNQLTALEDLTLSTAFSVPPVAPGAARLRYVVVKLSARTYGVAQYFGGHPIFLESPDGEARTVVTPLSFTLVAKGSAREMEETMGRLIQELGPAHFNHQSAPENFHTETQAQAARLDGARERETKLEARLEEQAQENREARDLNHQRIQELEEALEKAARTIRSQEDQIRKLADSEEKLGQAALAEARENGEIRRVESWGNYKVGQTVRLKDRTMDGEILVIQEGPWSNGGVPMAKVRWASGSSSRVTITKLVILRPAGQMFPEQEGGAE